MRVNATVNIYVEREKERAANDAALCIKFTNIYVYFCYSPENIAL